MNSILQDLINVLDLEPLEVNLFRGQSRDLGGHSVFGGQVIGQALVAATRTVPPDRPPHSLHAYFLRPGDMAAPIVYKVDHTRDGRSFNTRGVEAIQHGEVILSMIASFHLPESGFEHAAPIPQVPPPEQLKPLSELVAGWLRDVQGVPPRVQEFLARPHAIELRPVKPQHPFLPEHREPVQHVWFKATGELPADPLLQQCVLAYASDFMLLGTSLLPHGVVIGQSNLFFASLDHAIWFHRPLRVDDWLLYTMESPSAQDARGLARGSIYDRQGRLVASVAQEGLLRVVQPR
jgi:acyl-CoA thioesterase-2